ncbi:hypothetical protein MAR_013760, partial [Mya arenaria]
TTRRVSQAIGKREETFVRAETVTISSDTCGDYFDFGSDSFIGPDVTVLYKGDPVNTRLEDGCYIKLINWDSFQQTICIDSWSCGSSTCCTWCGTTRTSNLYVLVKSSHAASRPVVDDVKLRFYRKGLPGRKSYESETSSSYTVGIVVQANLNMDNRRLDTVHTSPIQTQINTNRLLLRPHQRWEEWQSRLRRIFTIRTHRLRPMKTA